MTMAKTLANHGQRWSRSEQSQSKKEAKGNTPTRVIAVHLKRTESSIQNKAQERVPVREARQARRSGEALSDFVIISHRVHLLLPSGPC
jgi:hypothetical protein